MPIFLIGCRELNIEREDVERQANSLEPDMLPTRNYSVAVSGKVFPIRQLMAEVADLSPETVSTLAAYKVLTELGFEVSFKR